MDINLFWTAFGAIGGTVGALATAVAVIVALWQTKYSQKKKLKLSFYSGIAVMIENKEYLFVGISIANVGNRDVVIQNWGWCLDNKELMLVHPILDFPLNQMQVQLPYKLSIEEQITLYLPKDNFLMNISENIQKKTLKANKPIKFWVLDSTGKNHYFFSQATANEMLLKTIQLN